MATKKKQDKQGDAKKSVAADVVRAALGNARAKLSGLNAELIASGLLAEGDPDSPRTALEIGLIDQALAALAPEGDGSVVAPAAAASEEQCDDVPQFTLRADQAGHIHALIAAAKVLPEGAGLGTLIRDFELFADAQAAVTAELERK